MPLNIQTACPAIIQEEIFTSSQTILREVGRFTVQNITQFPTISCPLFFLASKIHYIANKSFETLLEKLFFKKNDTTSNYKNFIIYSLSASSTTLLTYAIGTFLLPSFTIYSSIEILLSYLTSDLLIKKLAKQSIDNFTDWLSNKFGIAQENPTKNAPSASQPEQQTPPSLPPLPDMTNLSREEKLNVIQEQLKQLKLYMLSHEIQRLREDVSKLHT